MLEKEVTVICKKEDVPVVESVLKDSVDEFLTILKRESKKYDDFSVNLVIDKKKFIPENK